MSYGLPRKRSLALSALTSSAPVRSPTASALRVVAEDAVSTLRRLADNQLVLLQRLAAANADSEHLRTALESAKPHMAALESASHSAAERAQALLLAESRVTELRGTTCCLSCAGSQALYLQNSLAKAPPVLHAA